MKKQQTIDRSKRNFLALAGAGAVAVAAGAGRARAQTKELYVGIYDDISDVLKRVWIEPFEQEYGVKVHMSAGSSLDKLAKMRAEASNPRHSVMMMDDAVINQARQLGLTEPLTTSALPALAEVYPQYVLEDGHGVGIAIHYVSMAYNTAMTPPSSWRDLWREDLKRQVLIPSINLTNGVMMLIMAAALGGDKSVSEAQYAIDPGFEQIKALKPNLVDMFSNTASALNLLVQGEAKIAAPFYGKNINRFTREGAPVAISLPEEGPFAGINGACLVKNAPDPELAARFLDFGLRAEVQSALATGAISGPVNSRATMPEELRKLVPFQPQDIERMNFLDWTHINKERSAWTERWNQEVAG
ncbi:ABC transporter substrate-binding protein [Aquamicrobium ahrensii]|uniref:Spermidine/putrescine transport system substrate-binding protein n=1 Tax=Aquamicrobium ahrensii TaxID=469551 RepID=A0ABV2KJC6_9HYPH